MTQNKSTAVAVPLHKEVEHLLETGRAEIEKALPDFVRSQRFIRVALTEVRNNPNLEGCEPMSIVISILKAAQLGLEVGTTLGQSYLVPFRGRDGRMQCELIPGYKGLINLVRRSGEVSTFDAVAVYEGDVFKVSRGTDPSIFHIPTFESHKLTHVYAVCKFKDGGIQFEVMSAKQVENHRDRHSKQARGKAWGDSFDEMAKKTVIRRLIKMLPVTIEDPETELESKYDEPKPSIDVTRFKEISKAPDLIPKEDRVLYLKQVEELLADCHKKKIDVKDLTEDGYQAYDASSLVTLISILKERIDDVS